VNLLHRAAAPARAPPLQVPDALKLTIEPAANCDRYNQLLRPRVAVTTLSVHPHREQHDAIATDRTT
jgi:hypothetical protein